MKSQLNGVFVPITSPFLKSGPIDYKALEKNIEFYASTELVGCHVLGTNGENKSLSMDEKLRIVKTVIKKKGNLKVIAGCAFESTWETAASAEKYTDLGVDYVTLMAPSYYKQRMTDNILLNYFMDVASAVKVPCIIYNAPLYCGGIIISPGVIAELSKHENIIGLKDSSVGNIENYLDAVNGRIDILAGSANFFQAALMAGCSGGIISLSTVFPQLICKLYNLFIKKKYDEMIALNKRIIYINRSISGRYGVAGIKCAMDLAGISGGAPRAPLKMLDENEKTELASLLKREQLL